MYWVFAKVNNRLSELFFEKKGKGRHFFAHSYVKKSEYKTKHLLNWIEKETKIFRFKYKDGKYRPLA